MYNLNYLNMSVNKHNRDNGNSSFPVERGRKEVNPHTRTMENAKNPDTDSDREGRNIDIEQENQKNEITGREQQTTPRNKAEDIADRYGSREEKQKGSS